MQKTLTVFQSQTRAGEASRPGRSQWAQTAVEAAPLVLIIDDERELRTAVGAALIVAGMQTREAETGRAGVALAAHENPDLILLDLGLPDCRGIDVCGELRSWTSSPIIALSARHAELDKVAMLRAGADDYVSKPFGMTELIARVEAQLRRARTPHRDLAAVFEVDDLHIDMALGILRRNADPIRLTRTEWAIFRTLVQWAGRPVPHQEMFNAVWGRQFGNPSQYLRVYVTHLRRKIERDVSTPRVIITEPGIGYRLGSD